MSAVLFLFLFVIILFILYTRLNDSHLLRVPDRVLSVRDSPLRWTTSSIRSSYSSITSNPRSILPLLPPHTGRRYIVTGGAGFLGGWIVRHLIERGEDPRRIRVLDIRKPTRQDLCEGKAKDVDWRVCDVRSAEAVHAAFSLPWPFSFDENEDEITIFHTAACIRFYERTLSLLPLSAHINVAGTQNVLDAARSAGATVLVSTSSGSVALRRSRFWLWPWEKEPPYIVQYFGNENEDKNMIPRRYPEFFSNYAYTKSLGEELVLRGNNSPSAHGRALLTGCIRPGNGIYGPGGDVLLGAAIARVFNPTWINNVVQNFIYVENASYAHLCYERKLIDLANVTKDKNSSTGDVKGEKNAKDISGRAYYVTDAGSPPSYGDCYHAISVLTKGRALFFSVSPTLMLLISHLVEFVYLSRCALISSLQSFSSYLKGLSLSFTSPSALPESLVRLSDLPLAITKFLPPLPEQLLNLQPSLFALVLPHMLFSSYLAELELGYSPQITTLEGVCMLVDGFERDGRKAEARQRNGGERLGYKLNFGGLGGLRSRKKEKMTEAPIPSAVITKGAAVGMGVDVVLASDSGVDLRLSASGK